MTDDRRSEPATNVDEERVELFPTEDRAWVRRMLAEVRREAEQGHTDVTRELLEILTGSPTGHVVESLPRLLRARLEAVRREEREAGEARAEVDRWHENEACANLATKYLGTVHPLASVIRARVADLLARHVGEQGSGNDPLRKDGAATLNSDAGNERNLGSPDPERIPCPRCGKRDCGGAPRFRGAPCRETVDSQGRLLPPRSAGADQMSKGGTNMRAAGEKPDPVGRASGMAGGCPEGEHHEGAGARERGPSPGSRTADDSDCTIDPYSSAICDLGTKGCAGAWHAPRCGSRYGRAVCDLPAGHSGVHTGPVGDYEEYHAWPRSNEAIPSAVALRVTHEREAERLGGAAYRLDPRTDNDPAAVEIADFLDVWEPGTRAEVVRMRDGLEKIATAAFCAGLSHAESPQRKAVVAMAEEMDRRESDPVALPEDVKVAIAAAQLLEDNAQLRAVAEAARAFFRIVYDYDENSPTWGNAAEALGRALDALPGDSSGGTLESAATCLHLDRACASWRECAERTARHSAERARDLEDLHRHDYAQGRIDEADDRSDEIAKLRAVVEKARHFACHYSQAGADLRHALDALDSSGGSKEDT